MKKIDVQQIIDHSRFNSFHLTVLLWCFVIIVFDVYDLVIFGVVLPVLMEKWNLTPVEAGALGSYALFGMMFGALFLGPISDKIGRKKAIIICMLLFSLFTLLVTFSKTPAFFGICRFIAGLGIGGLMPNAVALTTEYAPKKMRALLTTLMFSGYGVGGMLAAGLGIWLVPNFGWESVFYVGALPLLFIPFIHRFMPESPEFLVQSNKKQELTKVLKKVEPTINLSEADQLVMPEKGKGVSLLQLFKNGRAVSTIMFWTCFFLCLLMVYGLNSWLPKLMTKAGYPLGSSISFLLVLNLGAMIGAILGGWLGDRFHLRRVIFFYFTVAAISLFLLGFKGSTLSLYLLIAVAGATIIGTQILLYAYVAQFYPTEIRSTGIGWASGVGRIGGILGPILGGTLLSLELPLQANFLAFAIPGALAAIAICFVSIRYSYRSVPPSTPIDLNIKTNP